MTTPTLLPTAPLEHPAMDYALLRGAGIARLERLAGRVWTDYNLHDPGITILEQLCYALSDLGYRIDYDLKDLLAEDEAAPYRSLFSPAEILTSGPVTLTDLRKVLLDLDGVRNAWVEPVEEPQPALYYDPADDNLYLKAAPHRAPLPLRGVYRVLIDAAGTGDDLTLLAAARERLSACRALGEVFEPPVILRKQRITVTATVEVGPANDPDRLLAELYHALARFIAPGVRFYRLGELLDRGLPMDVIMDGPPLRHGFIDAEELQRLERKQGLRASDLIQVLMDIPGVRAVDAVALSDGVRSDPWYLSLSESTRESTPVLDIELPGFTTPTIILTRNGAPVPTTRGRVRELFEQLRQVERPPALPEAERDIRLAPGRDRNVGRYHSIQHQFPAVYGIGELGLPASAPAERLAQAKQLKAYLLFFDQLLANAFAQLASVKELFSFFAPEARTYFTQLIEDPRLGLDELWASDRAARAAAIQRLTEAPAESVADGERKQRFLNHLLARFAEEFTDYSLQRFSSTSPEELFRVKSAFLRNYRELGAARGRAFNAAQPAWDNANVSGLEQRVSLKLGLGDHRRRALADLPADSPGGFHLVEPILLRPQQADLDQWAQGTDALGWQAGALLALPDAARAPQGHDPFALRLCFVFPAWVRRFEREFVERTLREETPAHLALQVQWLSAAQMRRFEAGYKAWLASLTDEAGPATARGRAARDHLIDLLRIGSPYPLREIKLSYQELVDLDQPAAITIADAQIGVRYLLCDEDGNPIVKGGEGFAAERAPDDDEAAVTLRTPTLTEDVIYTVMAVRVADPFGAKLENPLETFVIGQIALKVGINTALPVLPLPAAGQVAAGQALTIAYGEPIRVAVQSTQEGISYVLLREGEAAPISSPVEGNRAQIVLTAPAGDALTEDVTLRVKAYRTLETTRSELLEAAVALLVRPNPAVALAIEPTAAVVDYAGDAQLVLGGAQDSVEYVLYARDLVAADYMADERAGRLAVGTTGVFVAAPATADDLERPAGFQLVGTFVKKGRTTTCKVENLREDKLFIVVATKRVNRERLQMMQATAVLVRPDTAPAVTVATSIGGEEVVNVSGAQRGVTYQLRVDADDRLVGLPGYHDQERGLGTMRVAVDFVVEQSRAATDEVVLLPLAPLSSPTTYNVLATRLLSGISAELKDKVTLSLPPPANGQPPEAT